MTLRLLAPQRGLFRNRPKQKQEQMQKPRTAVFTAAAQAIRGKTYSRNSQSSTATPAEPGDLPFGLGTVEAIGQDGQMHFKMDGGRDVRLDPREHPHLDHGYAVTSHSSQGQTAEHVLIHVDTELAAKDLLNNRMAYVSVSRGQWDAQIFTNDREKLSQALDHDVSHQSASYARPEAAATRVCRDSEAGTEPAMDMGLSL